ncbi:MAG TPA: carboxypeptidase regulatory-like domain-containing protein, partial [Thermoanaerobaculia bacterium]|nr:carboxypeptidase regulatory-like domain-containing protein [Thermoanaerobaculia bacterium]
MSIRSLALVLACGIAALSANAAQKMVAIRDAAVAAARSSSPANFVTVGSQVFFTAADGTGWRDLWKTDGTEAGTVTFGDNMISSTASYSVVAVHGSELIFQLRESNSLSVWRTNGTAEGTTQIGALNLTGSYERSGAIWADDRVFVLVRPAYNARVKLWMAKLFAPGFSIAAELPDTTSMYSVEEYVGMNGKLHFVASDYTLGRQAWVSDGTQAGTHMLYKQVQCPGPACGGTVPRSFFRFGSNVVFLTNSALWKTDGTPAGTIKLADMTNARLVRASASRLFLSTDTSLWRTDGTVAGTAVIRPLQSYINSWIGADDAFWYQTLVEGNYQVWKLAGDTPELVTTYPAATYPFVSPTWDLMVGFNGTHYLSSRYTSATGTELFLVELAGGTTKLVDLETRYAPGAMSSSPSLGAAAGSFVVFAARTIAGSELWVSDGTEAGTKLLKNIVAEDGGGVITGVVTRATGGAPVPNTRITICTGSECVDSVYADVNGVYRFEAVIPGTEYKLFATATGYLTQKYEGIDCPCPDAASGTAVAVQMGFETTGIDFALRRGGTISGTVTSAATGQPIPITSYPWIDIVVRIVNESGAAVDSISVGASGDYTSDPLAPGVYYVYTYVYSGQYYGKVYGGGNCDSTYGCNWQTGQPVTVALETDTPDIDLAVQPFPRISGRVIDASTQEPIPGATVTLYRYGQPSYSTTTTETDADGYYTSPGLVSGTYAVTAMPQTGFKRILYPNIPCSSCDVFAGSPVAVGLGMSPENINFSMYPLGARLVGVIRDRNAKPIAAGGVQLLNAQGQRLSEDSVNDDGSYVLSAPTDGTYFLRAHDEVFGGGDCTAYSTCSVAGATPILLTVGQTARVNMQLKSGWVEISGKLLDGATGNELTSSATVEIYGTTSGQELTYVYGYGGDYSHKFLTRETAFRVVATSSGFRRTAYPNAVADCTPYYSCPAPTVGTIVPGDTATNIDITLQPLARITGTVRDAETGQPVPGADISWQEGNGYSNWAYADQNGKYTIHVGGGPVRIAASDTPYYTEIYNNRDCTGSSCDLATGDPITPVAGGVVSGIDFTLVKKNNGATIMGRVVDHLTGAGVANVNVYATPATSSGSAASVQTDANGYYKLTGTTSYSGLQPGTYRLAVTPPSPYFKVRYGGSHCASWEVCPDPGTPLDAPAGVIVDNINFSLLRLGVTAVSPAFGASSGGTRIVIDGANFVQPLVVRIGNYAATIESVTANRIIARTPSGLPGPAHVTVSAVGSLTVSLTHAYTYTSAVGVKGDFNADNKPDILWRNSDGTSRVWLMNGTSYTSNLDLPAMGESGWSVSGVDDFNSDGKADI